MSETPRTPAQMFDKLHALFGIGSYDDIASATPYHRERMVEIAKLKSLLKSRRASLAEVNIAADYAAEQHKPVHETWQVLALIPEAMRARFRGAAQAQREASEQEVQDAIQEALDAGEPGWAELISRAADKHAALKEWRSR